MQRVLSRLSYVVFAMITAISVGGCTDTESRTNLNPEGPPMIQQVRMFEKYVDGTPPIERSRRVFAFGTHELAAPAEVHEVTSAAALNGSSGNLLRIIIDELLVGNNLEEVACRGTVDTDALDRVPLGATPEDIARCASADDVLIRTCPGSNPLSMCICKNDAGCLVGSRQVAKGEPVGILDIDQDGAADETRMINGAVAIKCGATRQIDVPLNFDLSYWNPSGDQNRPAMGGFDALGPAIVLAPAGALPTNVECGLAFSEEVVDKQNQRVCAPPGGDTSLDCTPGDVSAFKFKVEPLRLEMNSFSSGATNVDRNGPIELEANVPLALTSLTAATITLVPAPPAPVTYTLVGTGMRTLRINGVLAPNTMYTLTITTGVTDTYGQALPQQLVVTFTTGA